MTSIFADRIWFNTATTGAGTITIGSALSSYQVPASAGIPSGSTVNYTLVDSAAWETGAGVLTSGTPWTLSRDFIEASSSGGAKLSLSGNASCFVTVLAGIIAGVSGLPTIAALRAFRSVPPAVLAIAGYYAPRDGGEGRFILVESDTTSADNGGTIIVDASGRRWYRERGAFATPQQFGAIADGRDCTAVINAMLAAIPVGLFLIPAGTYGLGGTVTLRSGQVIAGSGANATVFNVLSATADIFVFSGSGTAWGGMSGFGMTAGVTRTAGRYIWDVAGFVTVVENFSMNGAFVGIELATVVCYYRNGLIRETVPSTGIAIKITGGNEHFINNVTMDNDSPVAQCAYGIQIVQSGATYLSSISVIRSGIGIGLIPQNGNNVDWFSATDVLCDTCTNQGWLLECGGNGVIRGAVLENCWTSSNGVGMYVDKVAGTIDTISLTNFRCINNLGVGINLASCSRWTQIGGYVASNSQVPLATQAGLSVAPTCDHVILKGIQFGGLPGLGDSQLDQIILGDGVDFVHIEGCNLTTSHTALAYATIGNNVTIRNNFGFVNEWHGAGVVNNGTTSNTVPHGLTIAPAVYDIVISPTSSMAACGINSAWVSAVSPTTFTVSVNAAPSTPFFFAWSCKVLTAGAR